MKKTGFTLIELLVVVAIIGILAAILIPAVNTMMRRAAITQTQADLRALVLAWKGYFNEYNQWPLDGNLCMGQDASENGPGIEARWNILITILHPALRENNVNIDRLNPRRIQFLSYEEGSLDPESHAFVDAWGNTNRFLFDRDFDGKVTRQAGPPVYDNVIAWSLGPDGVPSDDDVTSWSVK